MLLTKTLHFREAPIWTWFLVSIWESTQYQCLIRWRALQYNHNLNYLNNRAYYETKIFYCHTLYSVIGLRTHSSKCEICFSFSSCLLALQAKCTGALLTHDVVSTCRIKHRIISMILTEIQSVLERCFPGLRYIFISNHNIPVMLPLSCIHEALLVQVKPSKYKPTH